MKLGAVLSQDNNAGKPQIYFADPTWDLAWEAGEELSCVPFFIFLLEVIYYIKVSWLVIYALAENLPPLPS